MLSSEDFVESMPRLRSIPNSIIDLAGRPKTKAKKEKRKIEPVMIKIEIVDIVAPRSATKQQTGNGTMPKKHPTQRNQRGAENTAEFCKRAMSLALLPQYSKFRRELIKSPFSFC